MTAPKTGHFPTWVLGFGTAVFVVAALIGLAIAGGQSLPESNGPPIEEVAVERTVLTPGVIELTVRNTGPDPVTIAQVFVNDAYVDFSGADEPITRLRSQTVDLDYPWIDGQPYLVSMLTSTGLIIEHEITAAVLTPQSDARFLVLMALLGTYVGIVPVVLGMLFLPFLRAAGRGLVQFLLAFTVGLLAFLAVDATSEALELAAESGGAFGGTMLVVLGAALAFLALTALDQHLRTRRAESAAGDASDENTGMRLALLTAIGIGLHNLGEGLAIGSAYAVGELALGAFLVIGFALHNTTEGIAVVAPLTVRRPSIAALLGLGLIAGTPAIPGAMLGAAVNNTSLSALLLGFGVGAIVKVIAQIAPSLRGPTDNRISAPALGGVAVGLLVMYATGLLVTV
ncbi:MAG: ZIP family metal transporter [Actinomycetia bacterium]|nr:ZIP family metal transporter [Actinomycetes bacterium]